MQVNPTSFSTLPTGSQSEKSECSILNTLDIFKKTTRKCYFSAKKQDESHPKAPLLAELLYVTMLFIFQMTHTISSMQEIHLSKACCMQAHSPIPIHVTHWIKGKIMEELSLTLVFVNVYFCLLRHHNIPHQIMPFQR